MNKTDTNLAQRLRLTKCLLLTLDAGLLLYWIITALHLIPPSLAFRDYSNPVVVAWNWSFLPLDVLAISSGFAWALARKRQPHASASAALLLITLTLTFAAGLMAISFWAIAGDFEWSWWLPNILLMVIPAACGYALRELWR